MRETWYVLEDETFGDPREVALGDDGVLRHKNGKAVALGPHGPLSSGVDLDDKTGKPLFDGKGDHDRDGKTGGAAKAPEVKDVTAAKPKARYKTRETKAR